MKIELAKNIGFCGGVAKAVKIAEQSAKKFGEVLMLGDIVHNFTVVQNLAEQGVKVVENIDEINKTKPLLLRAHGTAKKLEEKLAREGYFIIDATCPLVKEIHTEAMRLENEGRQVIIIGDHGHDEVLGIESRLKNPLVIKTVEEAENIHYYPKIGVVVQSTQFLSDVHKIVAVLEEKCDDFHFSNTICNPTKIRQSQVVELAGRNDLMLIVGSKTSANTKRLTQIARAINTNTFQVESVQDIDKEWLKNIQSVGISGGASTPDYVIESIKKSIEKVSENLLN